MATYPTDDIERQARADSAARAVVSGGASLAACVDGVAPASPADAASADPDARPSTCAPAAAASAGTAGRAPAPTPACPGATAVTPADAAVAPAVPDAPTACPVPAASTPADRAAAALPGPAALVVAVEDGSPAWEVGLEPGCYLTSVDGQPLRDVIDWRWLASDDVITVGYVDLDGETGEVELERECGQDWGVTFRGVVFDRVKLCRNACVFCFMRQLPEGSRASLSLRDDDFRLSFLAGTFVTLTNLTAADEARIVEQRMSPLRVSLHASDPDLRRRMIGRHAQHGIDALDRLLAAGIEAHCQIVLMPGVNDGDALRETLEWAYARPGILTVGIVPLGYTRHQERLERSFDAPDAARAVLETIEPLQRRALAERGEPWVFAADEFYRNAFLAATPAHVPPAAFYGDFDLFEDGIGIIRSFLDDLAAAEARGLADAAARAIDAAGRPVRYVVGEAMQPWLDELLAAGSLASRLVPLTVANRHYGGNVNVTGLLAGRDIAAAVRAEEAARLGGAPAPAAAPAPAGSAAPAPLYVIPRVILNDAGVTLDDMTVPSVEKAAGAPIAVVSCNPQEYLAEIIALLAEPAV